MINIRVTAHFGSPPARALVGEFDEMGGTIGRTPGNTLVLPDPRRFISRTHAAVSFRAGSYFIRDLGTATPVIVNGKPLGNGNEARIDVGDELAIEGYAMEVLAAPNGAPAITPSAAVVEAPQGQPRHAPPASLGASPQSSGPFADLIPSSPTLDSAAGQLLQPQSEAVARSTHEAQPRAPTGQPDRPVHAIPDDFDPFAEPLPAAARDRKASSETELDFGPAAANRSIDELFGLNAKASEDPFQPGNPLAASFDDSESMSNTDPLVAMGTPAPRRADSQAPQRDDTPEIFGSFPLPKTMEKASPAANLRSAGQLGVEEDAAKFRLGAGNGSDLDDRLEPTPIAPDSSTGPAAKDGTTPDAIADIGSVALPQIPLAPVLQLPAEPSEDETDQAGKVHTVAGRSESNGKGEHPTTTGASFGFDDLLREFLAGAGVPDMDIPGGITPQFMNAIGQLLHESTQGALDLLYARSMTKLQLHADMTVIVAKENNPLKFSPTVESALHHLLAPRDRGFLPPRQALKDAYNDLRSHEVAFMAGMRAALGGILGRFRPDKLEKRLTATSVVDTLLPIHRKAKLWDIFAEFYQDISKEAEDDFHTLFGREFLRAYQAQIAELERDEDEFRQRPVKK